MSPAAEKRNQLDGQCLLLPVSEHFPYAREEIQPQGFGKGRVHVSQLGDGFQKLRGCHFTARLQEFDLSVDHPGQSSFVGARRRNGIGGNIAQIHVDVVFLHLSEYL